MQTHPKAQTLPNGTGVISLTNGAKLQVVMRMPCGYGSVHLGNKLGVYNYSVVLLDGYCGVVILVAREPEFHLVFADIYPAINEVRYVVDICAIEINFSALRIGDERYRSGRNEEIAPHEGYYANQSD